jgi:hypothetical protein
VAVYCPASITLITPPQLHINLHVFVKAGKLPTNTVGEPGTQGEDVTGTQGMGVITPSLAAVAAATVGLAIELHIPKGGMLAIGAKSIMLPTGLLLARTPCPTKTKELGATPKVQVSCAPRVTSIPIPDLLIRSKWIKYYRLVYSLSSGVLYEINTSYLTCNNLKEEGEYATGE